MAKFPAMTTRTSTMVMGSGNGGDDDNNNSDISNSFAYSSDWTGKRKIRCTSEKIYRFTLEYI